MSSRECSLCLRRPNNSPLLVSLILQILPLAKRLANPVRIASMIREVDIGVVRILRINAQSRPRIPKVAGDSVAEFVTFDCATASSEVDGEVSILDEESATISRALSSVNSASGSYPSMLTLYCPSWLEKILTLRYHRMACLQVRIVTTNNQAGSVYNG
jgi:hypothetical protein